MLTRYCAWNPWREMERIQTEVERAFPRSVGEFLDRFNAFQFPTVQIRAGKDDVKVIADVPGMDVKDIEISVLGNTLTISGERKPEEPEKDAIDYRRERDYRKFIRTIDLPVDIDKAKIEAKYANGRLTITLPRAEEAKPRQIAVKAE